VDFNAFQTSSFTLSATLLLSFGAALCQHSQGSQITPLFPLKRRSPPPCHLQPCVPPPPLTPSPPGSAFSPALPWAARRGGRGCSHPEAVSSRYFSMMLLSPHTVAAASDAVCSASTRSCSRILGCKSLTGFSNRLSKGKPRPRLGQGYRLTAVCQLAGQRTKRCCSAATSVC